MLTMYVYEVDPTNTGFIVIDQIVTGCSYEQLDRYYKFNYDSDSFGYQFSNLGLTTTKQTRYTNLEG